MKDLTKYFIDLSKLSDEQLKEVEKVSGWNVKHIQDFPILSLRFSTLCQYGKDSDWVKVRTELTYPEFIKLFEGGEGENNGWIKIESEADLPKKEGLYWVRNKNSAIELVQFCGGPESKDVGWKSWLISYSHYQKPEPPKF